jgi:DNA-binding transcriptional ArsR family regulator
VIQVDVGVAPLTRIRISTSPLWEAVAGLALLARHGDGAPWPYDRWSRAARRSLRTTPASALVELFAALRGAPPPGFLTPVPPAPCPSLETELDALCRQPESAVAEGLARTYPGAVPDPFHRFVDDPGAAVAWFAAGIAHYWEAALMPYWPVVRTTLEEEILLRGRTLATQGPDALLAKLHPRLHWERPTLAVAHSGQPGPTVSGDAVILVPLLFGRGLTTVATSPGGGVAVSYQARGAAVLSTSAAARPLRSQAPERGDRLAIAVGRGRAALMRALVVPTTTTALADAVGLATSTVSEHLAALLSAGLVTRRRAGARVLYGLDRSGSALLAYLDNDQRADQGGGPAG